MFQNEKRLTWSIAITLLILVGEVIGGVLSNSLALLSDAGHVLTDAMALSISLAASLMSHRPAGKSATYGYHRIGVLAASINGLTLVAVALYIFTEAYHRMLSPAEINTGLMLTIALIGFAGNMIMAWILNVEHHDLNLRSARLHVFGDALSSLGVIIAGIVIILTGWSFADIIASIIVGVLIIAGGIRVLKDALTIFLEMTPAGFDIEEISRQIAEFPEVIGIHDIHIWSIGAGSHAFTGHLWIHDQSLSSAENIRRRVEHRLADIGIDHTVLQLECADCCNGELYCRIKPRLQSPHKH